MGIAIEDIANKAALTILHKLMDAGYRVSFWQDEEGRIQVDAIKPGNYTITKSGAYTYHDRKTLEARE